MAVVDVVAPAPSRAKLLRRLARGRSALVPVPELPKLWGLAPDAAAAELAALLDDQAFEVWEAEPVPSVILSSTTAASLGLVLLSPESDRRANLDTKTGRARLWWRPAAEVKPERSGLEVSVFSDLRDDQTEDDFGADLIDPATVRPGGVRPSAWSPPVSVVGDGFPWPQALQAEPQVCPGCRGRKLDELTACLPCLDRPVWKGRQAEMEADRALAALVGAGRKPAGRRLAGGKGKAAAGKVKGETRPKRKGKAAR